METCMRCLGRGEFTVTLGEPGTERHCRYVDVVWQEPQGPFRCVACKGTGKRRVKPIQPSRSIRNMDITEVA